MTWATIGLLASLLGALQALTQAYRVVRERNDYHALRGFSLPSWVVAIVASALWLAYGISQGDLPLISNNVVWVSCEATILLCVARAHLRERRAHVAL